MYAVASATHDPLLERVHRLAPTDGHHSTALPNLKLYRFSAPTSFRKLPVLGVTLGVVLQGRKRVTVEREHVDIDPGHALLFTRDAWQDAQIAEAPYAGLSVKFCPERVARSLLAISEAGAPPRAEPLPALRVERDPRVTDALVRLLDTMADPVEMRVLAPLVLDELLFHLLRSDAAATLRAAVGRTEDAERVLAAMAWMREHAGSALTVPRIARQVAMSPSHFAHTFRAIARVSPMRWVRQLRLEAARDLLLDGRLRVGEVAERTGYRSAAHFTRDFTRQFGQPPTRFRSSTTAP